MSAFFGGSDSERSGNLEFESDEQAKAYIEMTHDEMCGFITEPERTLLNNTFSYSCGFCSHCAVETKIMDSELAKQDQRIAFHGIIIDTGANPSSLMSLRQYLSYCQEHDVPALLQKKCKRLGGTRKRGVRIIGIAAISNLFPDVGVTLDVQSFLERSKTALLYFACAI